MSNLEPPPNQDTPVDHPQFRQWIYQLWERVIGRRSTVGNKSDDGTLLAAFRSNSRSSGGGSLTATRVGYGSATNTLTGDANLTWTSGTRIFTVGTQGTNIGTLRVTSTNGATGYIELLGGASINEIKSGSTGAVQLLINSSQLFFQSAGVTWGTGSSTGLNSVAIGATTASTGRFTTLQAGLPSLSDMFFGNGAGNLSATGTNNVGLGTNAMASLSSGTNNVAVGSNAGNTLSSGTSNTACGNAALRVMGTGTNCTAVGASALELCTGNGNTAVGSGAGDVVSSATNNTLIGTNAGGAITTAPNNVAVGVNALSSLSTGTGRNTAIGEDALLNCTGNTNVAIGFNVGSAIGAGSTNVLISSGEGSSGQSNNVMIGSGAGNFITTSGNTCVGTNAGRTDIFGTGSATGITAFGNNALGTIDTGANCTGVGNNAGSNLATGSNSMCLGNGSAASSSSASNEITLGNTSITTIRAQVTSITAISDARDKTDIVDLPVGLEFVNALRPRRFTWNMRDGGKVGIQDYGFIAQEVQEAESGIDYLSLVYSNNPDRLELSQGKLIPILVKAIQELSAEVERLKNA